MSIIPPRDNADLTDKALGVANTQLCSMIGQVLHVGHFFRENADLIGHGQDSTVCNDWSVSTWHVNHSYRDNADLIDKALGVAKHQLSTMIGQFLHVNHSYRDNADLIDKALGVAKTQLCAMIGQVQSFLDIHQIMSAGPYLYTLIQEGTSSVRYFSKPQCLTRLARFTLEAHCSMSRNKRALSLPLVLAAPLDPEQGTLIVIGIPPLELDDEKKNFFGKAFEQAAIHSKARTLHDFFDPNIIELKIEDKSRFFDGLISLLQ